MSRAHKRGAKLRRGKSTRGAEIVRHPRCEQRFLAARALASIPPGENPESPSKNPLLPQQFPPPTTDSSPPTPSAPATPAAPTVRKGGPVRRCPPPVLPSPHRPPHPPPCRSHHRERQIHPPPPAGRIRSTTTSAAHHIYLVPRENERGGPESGAVAAQA